MHAFLHVKSMHSRANALTFVCTFTARMLDFFPHRSGRMFPSRSLCWFYCASCVCNRYIIPVGFDLPPPMLASRFASLCDRYSIFALLPPRRPVAACVAQACHDMTNARMLPHALWGCHLYTAVVSYTLFVGIRDATHFADRPHYAVRYPHFHH